MRIFVDTTEPGIIFQDLSRRAAGSGITVDRTILHKREGLGGSAREAQPFCHAPLSPPSNERRWMISRSVLASPITGPAAKRLTPKRAPAREGFNDFGYGRSP